MVSMRHGTATLESVWLHNNPRVRVAAMLFAMGGLGMIVLGLALDQRPFWVRLASGMAGGFVVLVALLLAAMNFGARIAYARDRLWIRFGLIRSFPLPLDIVEVFFHGQEPLPTTAAQGPELRTANIMIRIADSAADWQFREIPPPLGRWCGGYIVLRGLWCQPITANLLQELNQRLVQAKRQASTRQVPEFSSPGDLDP